MVKRVGPENRPEKSGNQGRISPKMLRSADKTKGIGPNAIQKYAHNVERAILPGVFSNRKVSQSSNNNPDVAKNVFQKKRKR